jgi:FkbM family methyltransferase
LHKLLKFLYSLNIPFFKRIIPSFIKRFSLLGSNKIINLHFSKIKLDLTQAIDREIYLSGFYEKEQLNYLDKICSKKKIDYFFDIGSNIGYYSLYFKDIENIYSFEPNKNNFISLKENIRINNLNIKAYNFGLSNSNSETEIWYTDKKKMGGSAIFQKDDPELKKYNIKNLYLEKISVKKLDDIVDINQSTILVKIDVERHEKKVLEGMKNTINNNSIILQIEVGEEQKNEVFGYLKELNFTWINTIRHDHYFIKE